jgi:hypothetical protein
VTPDYAQAKDIAQLLRKMIEDVRGLIERQNADRKGVEMLHNILTVFFHFNKFSFDLFQGFMTQTCSDPAVCDETRLSLIKILTQFIDGTEYYDKLMEKVKEGHYPKDEELRNAEITLHFTPEITKLFEEFKRRDKRKAN